MPSLFRREVIDDRQQAWLGTIQLVRPVPLAVLTTLIAATACLIGAFLVEGHYTRKAHIAGYLAPDRSVVRVSPTQAGIISQSRAVEGRAVTKGDVLFVLSVDSATRHGDTRATVGASLAARSQSLQNASRQKAELLQEQQGALDRQLQGMRRELAQMDSEHELQQQRMALAQEALAQYESLRQQNFVSSAQVRSKTEEMLAVRAQVEGLARQRTAHLRQMDVLEAQRRELPMRTREVQGEIERDIAALAQASAENDAKKEILVTAPQSGVVTAILVEPGRTVAAGSVLASVIPMDTRMQAQLFAPSSAVGFVRPDQPVQLRYQAYPYQKFGHQAGQVLHVSRTPLQPSELANLPLPETMKSAATAEPLYRITVTLDRQAVLAYGQSQPLVDGMQLEADVMLDRRRLIEWIFEPLLSVTGRV